MYKTVLKSIFYILFFVLMTVNIHTQVSQQWVSIYNGPGNGEDNAYALAVDSEGYIYVTGGSVSNLTGMDYCTIKYDQSGVQQWIARYNGLASGFDQATAIAISSSGAIYVTGNSGAANQDICTVRYTSNGVQSWAARFNDDQNWIDRANSIAVDRFGYVYVTGYSSGSAGSNSGIVTLKYSSGGFLQWVKRYAMEESADEGFSIKVDSSGNSFITGQSKLYGNFDYLTAKYNTNGEVLWYARYNGPGNGDDRAFDLKLDRFCNVYITGESWGGASEFNDFCTIRYDSSGVQQWVARWNGPSSLHDRAYSLALDNSGNVFVTGNNQNSTMDFATIKYNNSGVQQWNAVFNGSANNYDESAMVIADASGSAYVTGRSLSASFDFITIKYNPSGTQSWIQTYNGSGNFLNASKFIGIDYSGSVIITGYNNNDYCTIKYLQTIGIKSINNEIPHEFKLFQNYPNPFNPVTIFRFQLPVSGNIKLVVYDILGREITTLVNEQLSPGTYEVEWDARNFASGIYYYQLIASNFSKTKKMIIIK